MERQERDYRTHTHGGHYFATTASGFGYGTSIETAIQEASRRTPKGMRPCSVDVFYVPLPADAEYTISFFRPVVKDAELVASFTL